MARPQHIPSIHVSSGSLEDINLLDRWEALCSTSPQYSPFSSPVYARGIKNHLGFRVRLFIVSQENVDIAGLLTYSRKLGPFEYVTIPPFTSFSSLITQHSLLPSTTPDALAPFSLLLKKIETEFDRILLHQHPELHDMRVFQWNNWITAPLYTYIIDLSHRDGKLKQWSTSARRTYRKFSPEYHFKEDDSAISNVIDLCKESYGRHHRPLPVNPAELADFISYLRDQSLVRIFTLTPITGQIPSAAIALLIDREIAYYWIAGSVPGHSMTVLLGNLFPLLRSEGIKLFDFVGANTQLIAEFKRRFGPTLTPYYAASSYPNRLFAFLSSIKRVLRR